MRELGVENVYIELLEECPCDNVEQLRKREGELIRQIGKDTIFLKYNKVREEHSRSSRSKSVTFERTSSTRSVFPQLRLENRNFKVHK